MADKYIQIGKLGLLVSYLESTPFSDIKKQLNHLSDPVLKGVEKASKKHYKKKKPKAEKEKAND